MQCDLTCMVHVRLHCVEDVILFLYAACTATYTTQASHITEQVGPPASLIGHKSLHASDFILQDSHNLNDSSTAAHLSTVFVSLHYYRVYGINLATIPSHSNYNIY